MDNLNQRERIKLLVLALFVLIAIPLSYGLYSKKDYPIPTQSSSSNGQAKIANANVIAQKLPNNTSTKVITSINSYTTSVGLNNETLSVVDNKITEGPSSYSFFLSNKEGSRRFRVDVVIAGFDTAQSYINGALW
jgi:hypothetical protein